MGSATPRIQCLLLKLQPYQLNVLHRPGKEMFVVDTLSRDTTAATVIKVTKSILARHGVLDEIKSDNGPQFATEYKRFSKDWNFKHTIVFP